MFEIRFPAGFPHAPPFFRILKPRFLPFSQVCSRTLELWSALTSWYPRVAAGMSLSVRWCLPVLHLISDSDDRARVGGAMCLDLLTANGESETDICMLYLTPCDVYRLAVRL